MSQEYTAEQIERVAADLEDLVGVVRAATAVEMLRAFATLRQAARGPQFASADELAHWLESLHECDSDGSVGSRKWEAAQVAARAVRGMGSQAARVEVTDEVVEDAWMAFFKAKQRNEYDRVAMRAALEAALSAQPAERQGAEGIAEIIDALPHCSERTVFTFSRDKLQALLRHAAPVGVPDGWKLVPEEPTFDMQAAHRIYGDTSDWWSTVLAAAPSQRAEVK